MYELVTITYAVNVETVAIALNFKELILGIFLELGIIIRQPIVDLIR